MLKAARVSLLLGVCLGLTPIFVYAQTASTGGITGVVTDPSGAVVPGAGVIVKNDATGEERTTTSDSAGRFSATLLRPGKYTVAVQSPGMATLTIKDVLVQITELTPVEAQLKLGAAKEAVVVKAASPLLQTTNATIGRVIPHDTIVDLPLVNRNYTQILGLTAGINTDLVDATQLGEGSQEIRANGARSGDNNFMINGVDSNSYGTNITEVTAFAAGGIAIPAPDSIQEFKVQTTQYDAQFGRSAGANLNIETRSGTSGYHGNVYFFGRNDVLNANNFFANATGQRRGKFLRSQPGGTFGGPLVKDRIFFFVSEQSTRDRNGASLDSSIRSLILPPIPLDRSPQSLGAVFGGQTGLIGGVAIAPDGSNINPVALALLNLKNPDGTFLIPSPQSAGPGVNFTSSKPGEFREDQFNSNLDFNLRSSDQLSMKFFWSNQRQLVPFFGANVPGFPAIRFFRNRNFAISETHTFSPHLINLVRFGFSRIAGQGTAESRVQTSDVGIQRFSDPDVGILPQIQVLGAFTLGNSANDRGKTANNNFHFMDTLSYSRGTHNVRAGTEVFRNQFNIAFKFDSGFLLFLSTPDFLLGLPAGPVTQGGNGTPFSNVFGAIIAAGPPAVGGRSTAGHFFIQDDWKVKPNLTVNLGFRLEVNGQQSEVKGRLTNFFPKFYVPPPPGGFTSIANSGLVIPDNFPGPAPPEVRRANPTLLDNPTQVHAEPRIGLAWRPLAGKDFVIRAGYGIYANRISFVGESQQLTFAPPFTADSILFGSVNGLASFQSPFPEFPSPSAFPNFNFLRLAGPPYNSKDRVRLTAGLTDPEFKESSVQQWSLDLQYQVKDYVLTLGYVGAKGTHLAVSRDPNQAILASPSNPVNGITDNSAANASLRIPFLGLSPLVIDLGSPGNSIYNSLQVSVQKAMSHGFQFLAAYTLSKSIDNAADSTGSALLGSFGVPTLGEFDFNDQNTLRDNRGLSDFDRRHRFVVSYVWDLPFPKSIANPVGRKLLEGWSVSGVTTLQSGRPFSIFDSGAGTLFGSPSFFFTASLAPGKTLRDAQQPSGVDPVKEFFNTSAFAPAPFVPNGTLIDGKFPVSDGGGALFGNLGRNILTGPNQKNFDIGISKRTRVNEKVSLLFRWEFFNSFNRPNFDNPNSDIEGGPSFGTISRLASNPRIMQYALKIEF